ncbi:MAG: MerC domain-containing protein [Verrucomicrobiota bacterium]|nr:MerC domain-containing protein [Verrucomicrobiota bacterium]MEE2813461.1 MerC domain-containing protein [Verrucomicrobiota bacterium]
MRSQGDIDATVAIEHESALYDRAGLFASSVCAVHCIVMPWLIMLLPVLAGTIFTSAKIENIFVGFSISLATFCGYQGCLKHSKWLIMLPVVIGSIVLFSVRLTAPTICCLDDISWLHALGSAFGGGLLASTHFLNLKYSGQYAPEQKAPCCHSDSCSAHESEGK